MDESSGGGPSVASEDARVLRRDTEGNYQMTMGRGYNLRLEIVGTACRLSETGVYSLFVRVDSTLTLFVSFLSEQHQLEVERDSKWNNVRCVNILP